MKFDTKLLHGNAVRKYAHGATLPAISQVSAFRYETAEEQEKVFQHKAEGYAYSRVGNPTVAAFEQRINELEGGNAAIACSSGMSAITLALLNLLSSGDEIIAASGIYGGSIDLFEDLTKFGISIHYVRHLTPEEIAPLITDRTRVIFGEVIGNPGLDIIDIGRVADFAHSRQIPLMVDATTVTPCLVNPLLLGADIIVHSSSKYINGDGNSISGVIIDGANFPWNFDRFTGLSGYRKFGKLAYTIRLRTDIWENMGSCLSPFNAFLNILGLETLGIRMERICSNAARLAEALAKTGLVKVNYPGLSGNPYRGLVKKELNGKAGGILTFRAGTKERAFRILNGLQYAERASNIGDVRTLVIHPASTLYIRSSASQREAAGVYDDMIRVSVGIEDPEDLIEDFIQAIRKGMTPENQV